jgi:hypothetical protein
LFTIYADDTSQDVTDKSVDIIETKLICDLKSSMNWMNENKLTMNLKKTQCMLVAPMADIAVALPVFTYG